MALLGLVWLTAAGVMAGVVTPVSDAASSFYSAMQDPTNLINGSGLLGSGDILTQTHNNNSSAVGMWHSSGGAVNTTWVSFDFGAPYTLTAAYIWQMNQAGNLGRGVNTFGLFVSPNATDPITNYVGTFSLAEAGGTTNEAHQTVTFAAIGARQVLFAITNDWNGWANDYVGLSEVRFEGSAMAAIVQQPQSATNYAWGAQTFSVLTAGTPPLSYQWYRAGSPAVALAGATNSSYTINPVTNGSAGGVLRGGYQCAERDYQHGGHAHRAGAGPGLQQRPGGLLSLR